MGCDIHAYLESKPKGNKKWQRSEHIDLPRHYAAFAFLADVRNYESVPYPFEEKGLPDDLAEFTASEWDIWDCDAHSMSYLNLEELREVFKRYSEYYKKEICDSYSSLIPKMEQLEADGNDCRLVFWFDN